jgi:hypothetical protein
VTVPRLVDRLVPTLLVVVGLRRRAHLGATFLFTALPGLPFGAPGRHFWFEWTDPHGCSSQMKKAITRLEVMALEIAEF